MQSIRFAILILLAGHLRAQTPAGAFDPAALIESTVRAIEAGNDGVIEILRIPDDAEFRVNVNPERLEKWWDYKLTIRHLWARPEELTNALRVATIQPSNKRLESLDLRWGVLFYSKMPEGKRLVSLYFDWTGRHGAVDTMSVSFGPDFLILLRKALHCSLE